MASSSSSSSKYVDELINSHKVVVFSKIYCPYCTKAKNVLKKFNINDLIIIEIENRDDCDDIQKYLSKITGASTVPRVFINGKCIGGGDDTARLDKDGKLEQLLKECNAI